MGLPFYHSPQDNMGYDVANYETVRPIYGINKDYFKLINKTNEPSMIFITDLVIKHRSTEHE